MHTLVIYTSMTGFTRRYAQWIGEETGSEILTIKEAKKKDLSHYNTILYGGWACAGSIKDVKWFKQQLPGLKGKRLGVYCVGASPLENPELEGMLKKNFTEEERKQLRLFYCPGGFDYEHMPAPYRLVMKMFLKANQKKKNKTEMDEAMIRMIGSSYDLSDKKYIQPMVDFINGK